MDNPRKRKRVAGGVRPTNKKLGAHVESLQKSLQSSASHAKMHSDILANTQDAGYLEPEHELEKTWKVTQGEIRQSSAAGVAKKSFTYDLEYGPYAVDFTSNGRHLALAGREGHVATLDWQAGKVITELNLDETVRDIAWLHNDSFFACAQKKYTYIYDRDGLEIHQLRNHIEVNRLQFLRHHFLLASVGNAGWLKYQDTSTGNVVAELRTKLGACNTMAQNHHSGIINLGHQNGTVTLWSPTVSTPHVKLLTHRGPVTSIAYDPAYSGQYFATSGLDSKVKVWDCRTWKCVNEWDTSKPVQQNGLTWSQKGLLAAAWGNHVTVYKDAQTPRPANKFPGAYMHHSLPSNPVSSLLFCPYEDILALGTAKGYTSLIIPGASEANYDSLEADPYETKKNRREREVASLLDKLQPDTITLDQDFIGSIALPEKRENPEFAKVRGFGKDAKSKTPYGRLSRVERLEESGQLEQEEKVFEDGGEVEEQDPEKKDKVKKARGRNKALKKIMRRNKNVIDAKKTAVKDLLETRRKEQKEARERAANPTASKGALSRFA